MRLFLLLRLLPLLFLIGSSGYAQASAHNHDTRLVLALGDDGEEEDDDDAEGETLTRNDHRKSLHEQIPSWSARKASAEPNSHKRHGRYLVPHRRHHRANDHKPKRTSQKNKHNGSRSHRSPQSNSHFAARHRLQSVASRQRSHHGSSHRRR